MNIVNLTFVRALRRARIRLGDDKAAREHERMAHDQKYQAALMAAQRVAALEAQEIEWKRKMALKMAELESVRLEADEAQGRLKTSKASIKNSNAANAEMDAELTAVTAQLEEQRILYGEHQTRFQSEVGDLTAEKARLTATLAAEKAGLTLQLSAAEAKLGTTQKQLHALTEDAQSGEERNKQLNNALEQTQTDLNEQITRLREQLVGAEEREKEMGSKITKLHSALKQEQAELRDNMVRLERSEAASKEEQETARANDAHLSTQLEEEHGRADTAEGKLRALQGSSASRTAELEQEVASTQRRYTELTDSSARSKADFLARESELEEKLHTMSTAATTSDRDREAQLYDRDEKITQATAQLVALRAQYELAESQLEAKEKQIGTAAKRLEEQRNQSEAAAKAKAGLFEEDIESARAKLTSQKALQEELEDELTKAKNNSTTLESELRGLKEEMESATDKSVRRASVLETETNALQTEKRRLAASVEQLTRDSATKDTKLSQLAVEMKEGFTDWEEKHRLALEEAEMTTHKLKKQLQEVTDVSLASATGELATANLRIKNLSEEHDRATAEMQVEMSRTTMLKDADLKTAYADLDDIRTEMDAITHAFSMYRDEAELVQQRLKNNELELEDKLAAITKKLGDAVAESSKLHMDGEDSARKVASSQKRESEMTELHSEELIRMECTHTEETEHLSKQLDEVRAQLDASKTAQEEAVAEVKEAGVKAAALVASTARAMMELEEAEETRRTKNTPLKNSSEIRALEEQLATASDKATTFERRVARFARNESELLRDLEKSKEDARAARQKLIARERLHAESDRVFANQLRSNEMALKKIQRKFIAQGQEQNNTATTAYSTLAAELSAARKELAEARERDIAVLHQEALAKQTITGLNREIRRVQNDGETSAQDAAKRQKGEAQQQIRAQQMELELAKSELAAAKSAAAAKDVEIKEMHSMEMQASTQGASSNEKLEVLAEALKGKEDELEAAAEEMSKFRRDAICAKTSQDDMNATLEELKVQLAQARSEGLQERGDVQANLEEVEMERDNLEAEVKILKLQLQAGGFQEEDAAQQAGVDEFSPRSASEGSFSPAVTPSKHSRSTSKSQQIPEDDSETLEAIDVLLSA
jgi:chromosome segregation ATPase